MIVEVVDTHAGLAALRDVWGTLFREARDPCVFCHYSWIAQAMQLATECVPLIVVVRSGPGGRVVGVFPLAVTERTVALRRFRTLVHASGQMGDFATFLVSTEVNPSQVVRLVVRCLMELEAEGQWQLCEIAELNDGDVVASLFRQALRRELYGGSVEGQATPVIELDRPFGVTKTLREIRRRERNLQATGRVECRLAAPVEEILLQQFRSHHQRAFPGVGFGSARGNAMMTALAADADFGELVDFSYMLVDGDLVAGHFGFRHSDRFYYYVPAFDEAWATFGPGQLLLRHLIEHHQQAGGTRFEFLRGMEAYKSDWLNRISTNWTLLGVGLSAPRLRRSLIDLWLGREAMPRFR